MGRKVLSRRLGRKVPGALADLTDAVRDQGGEIAGVFLAPARRATDGPRGFHAAVHRAAALRLETARPHGVVDALRRAGYRARAVRSLLPDEPIMEDS